MFFSSILAPGLFTRISHSGSSIYAVYFAIELAELDSLLVHLVLIVTHQLLELFVGGACCHLGAR